MEGSSLEREIDKAAKDIRDRISEAKHRTEAGAEKLERDTDPGTMSEGDRMRSAVEETKHNIQADVDKGKRELRDET